MLRLKQKIKGRNKTIIFSLILFLLIFISITPLLVSAQAQGTSGVDAVVNSGGGGATEKALFYLLGIDRILAGIVTIFLGLFSTVLTIAGVIFDFSIKFGIQKFSALAGNTSMVSEGWVIARDLANVVFIFLVLWAGISTILRLNHGSTMGTIMKIAVAALLINFSLFVTRAVIDIANTVALHFYSLILGNGTDGTLSGVFMQGLAMQSFYNPANLQNLEFHKIILFGALGSVMILIASWVFFAGALLMVYRTISLIILMITSPFAFISWVIPHMEHTTHDWWHKLFHQAFFAPIFLGMAYIVGKIVQSKALLGQMYGANDTVPGFSDAINTITNGGASTGVLLSSVGIFFNFIIVVGLLLASLHIAEHSAGEGAKTLIHWAEHARGSATSVFGREMVNNFRIPFLGKSIRDLNEQWSDSKWGKFRATKTLREISTGYLAEKATFGGHHTAEETHKEDLELRAERIESEHEDEAVVKAKERAGVEQTYLSKINEAEREILLLEESKKQSGANIVQIQTNIDNKKKDLDYIKQERIEALKKADGEVQRILSKLSPQSAAKMAKDTLFNEGIMRNMTLAQFGAVFQSDRLTEEERDRAGEARYGHIKKATEALVEPLREYEKQQSEYVKSLSGIIEYYEAKHPNFKIDPDNEADVKKAIEEYRLDQQQNPSGLTINLPKEPPKRPTIQNVDPSVRNWLRAMKPKEMDYIYRLFPEIAKSKEFCSTVRQGAIDYAKNQSDSIPQVDSDGMRENKSSGIGDGIYNAAGIGVNKPSVNTMKKIFIDLKLEDPAKVNTTEFEDFLKNMTEEEWEERKNTVIRKAIDSMMTDGTYTTYLAGLNTEQKALRTLGLKSIRAGIDGKTQEEVAKMRGWMWMNSDVSRNFDRGITKKFNDKDTDEKAKVVMHKLNALEDHLLWLETNGQSGKEITREDFDSLVWMVNDRDGQLFANRGALKGHLAPILDDLQTVLVGQKTSLLDDTTQFKQVFSNMLQKMGTQHISGKRYGQP